MPNDAILAEELTKEYRRSGRSFPALDGVSIRVREGEIYGLLGPNGAGKTTLVKILLGLRTPSRGKATLLGEPIGSHRARRIVGYLPEDHRLPVYLTGMQALEIYGMLQGLSRNEVGPRAKELLEKLDLSGWANQKVRRYSKGMKQRLGLAQSLLHRPRILFLDEPTDGVDPVGRKIIRDMIEETNRSEGTTVFINSHLLMEVEMICHRIAILHLGEKAREGTLDELIPKTNDFLLEVVPSESRVDEILNGVAAVEKSGVGFLVKLGREEDVDAVVDRLRERGVGIRGLTRHRLTLEEYFIQTIEGRQK